MSSEQPTEENAAEAPVEENNEETTELVNQEAKEETNKEIIEVNRETQDNQPIYVQVEEEAPQQNNIEIRNNLNFQQLDQNDQETPNESFYTKLTKIFDVISATEGKEVAESRLKGIGIDSLFFIAGVALTGVAARFIHNLK